MRMQGMSDNPHIRHNDHVMPACSPEAAISPGAQRPDGSGSRLSFQLLSVYFA